MSERKRPEWVDEAVRLYQEGLSLSQIAGQVGRGRETVRLQLLHVGTLLRTRREGIRLRRWRDTGTENLALEPNPVTIGLVGFGLGDGHCHANNSRVRYVMETTILRDYLLKTLKGLGLRPHFKPHSSGAWQVEVYDVRWHEFNKRFLNDFDWLCENALRWPDHFVWGLHSAEGCHFLDSWGPAHIGFSNKERRLLELTAECLRAIRYQATLVGPAKDGCYQLNLRGSSLAKVQFAVNSPYPNKRVPSNYLLRRHLLKPEIQRIYDATLEELYATYGKERVDRELLQAKRTKRV